MVRLNSCSTYLILRINEPNHSRPTNKKGVLRSEIFIAILTEKYFTRKVCVEEMRLAREAGKPIQPIVRVEDKERIGEFLEMAPADLKDLGYVAVV